MTVPVVVFGAGGHGREVAALIGALRSAGERWNFQGFLRDGPVSAGDSVSGMPILGGEEWLRAHPGVAVAMGIGSPRDRRRVVQRIRPLVASFPILVHPTALIMERVTLEEGVVVFAKTVVSVDAHVEAFASVNTHTSISHDCRVAPFASLGPGVVLAGNSFVGEGSDVGAGATFIPSARVGAWSVIGAGAVVIGELPGHCTAVGVPARVTRSHPLKGEEPNG